MTHKLCFRFRHHPLLLSQWHLPTHTPEEHWGLHFPPHTRHFVLWLAEARTHNRPREWCQLLSMAVVCVCHPEGTAWDVSLFERTEALLGWASIGAGQNKAKFEAALTEIKRFECWPGLICWEWGVSEHTHGHSCAVTIFCTACGSHPTKDGFWFRWHGYKSVWVLIVALRLQAMIISIINPFNLLIFFGYKMLNIDFVRLR